MRIVTWNVNSLRARQERVEAWIDEVQPDVLLMQETKLADDAFPTLTFAERGYDCAHYGQGQWNGVAILSKVGLDDVVTNFSSGIEPDPDARIITATTSRRPTAMSTIRPRPRDRPTSAGPNGIASPTSRRGVSPMSSDITIRPTRSTRGGIIEVVTSTKDAGCASIYSCVRPRLSSEAPGVRSTATPEKASRRVITHR